MTIKKNSGRQGVLYAIFTILFADIVVGAKQPVIDLPVGAVVVGGGSLVVDTAVTGGGLSAITIAVGDTTVANRLLAATSVFTATNTPLVPTGFKMTATQPAITIDIAMTGGTVPTAGEVRLIVPYIVGGRSESNCG
jgi:hypothetical protein